MFDRKQLYVGGAVVAIMEVLAVIVMAATR
jgi:hypothetical protein